MDKKGFTLIELLIVVAIIGILTGIVAVTLGNTQNSANDVKRKADINQLTKAVMIYKTNNTDTSLPIANMCENSSYKLFRDSLWLI